MSASIGTERAGLRGGPRRQELVECLPALREALERERAVRVEQLTAANVPDGAREAVADIERALAAIRAGTYGACEDCADDVPFEVLRAVPQARRCLRCHSRRGGDASVPTPPSPTAARCVRTAAPMPGARVASTPARPVVWVRRLLGRPILGPERQHLGHVRDVVARRLPDAVGTVMTGLVADAGGHRWHVPAATILDLRERRLVLRVFSIRPDGCRHPGEFLLADDVLGHLVMTVPGEPPLRISDIALHRTRAGWTVRAADTRTAVQRLLGSPGRVIDWDDFARRRLVTPARLPDGANGTLAR